MLSTTEGHSLRPRVHRVGMTFISEAIKIPSRRDSIDIWDSRLIFGDYAGKRAQTETQTQRWFKAQCNLKKGHHH